MERLQTLNKVGLSMAASGLILSACMPQAPEKEAEAIPATTVEFGRDYRAITTPNNYIVQRCDGPDLIETGGDRTKTGEGSLIFERSVNHDACADGKITPEDFKLPTADSE